MYRRYNISKKIDSSDSDMIIWFIITPYLPNPFYLLLLSQRTLHPQTKHLTSVCIMCLHIWHHLHIIWYKLQSEIHFFVFLLPIYIFLYMNALNFYSIQSLNIYYASIHTYLVLSYLQLIPCLIKFKPKGLTIKNTVYLTTSVTNFDIFTFQYLSALIKL